MAPVFEALYWERDKDQTYALVHHLFSAPFTAQLPRPIPHPRQDESPSVITSSQKSHLTVTHRLMVIANPIPWRSRPFHIHPARPAAASPLLPRAVGTTGCYPLFSAAVCPEAPRSCLHPVTPPVFPGLPEMRLLCSVSPSPPICALHVMPPPWGPAILLCNPGCGSHGTALAVDGSLCDSKHHPIRSVVGSVWLGSLLYEALIDIW